MNIMFITHTFFHSDENVYINCIENHVEKFSVLKIFILTMLKIVLKTMLKSFHTSNFEHYVPFLIRFYTIFWNWSCVLCCKYCVRLELQS